MVDAPAGWYWLPERFFPDGCLGQTSGREPEEYEVETAEILERKGVKVLELEIAVGEDEERYNEYVRIPLEVVRALLEKTKGAK